MRGVDWQGHQLSIRVGGVWPRRLGQKTLFAEALLRECVDDESQASRPSTTGVGPPEDMGWHRMTPREVQRM